MRTAIGQARPKRTEEQDQERHQAERRPFVIDQPADQEPEELHREGGQHVNDHQRESLHGVTPLRERSYTIGRTLCPESPEISRKSPPYLAPPCRRIRSSRPALAWSRRFWRLRRPHRIAVLGVDERRGDAGDEEREDARHHHPERETWRLRAARLAAVAGVLGAGRGSAWLPPWLRVPFGNARRSTRRSGVIPKNIVVGAGPLGPERLPRPRRFPPEEIQRGRTSP